jgi:hypothetical protein
MYLPIYVISTKWFVDRHIHMNALADSMGFDFEFIKEFDADELTADELEQVGKGLAPRSASNVLKHIEAQKKFLNSGADVALILEDDVILFENFLSDLKLVLDRTICLEPGWLIFLGGADNKRDDRFFETNELSLIEQPLSTAEAYLIDRPGALKRMEWLKLNKPDRQADHQLKLIDELISIRQYCVSHAMATQGSITGKFSTTLDSSRAKHSSLFLRTKYEFNRLRRQTMPRMLRMVTRFW